MGRKIMNHGVLRVTSSFAVNGEVVTLDPELTEFLLTYAQGCQVKNFKGADVDGMTNIFMCLLPDESDYDDAGTPQEEQAYVRRNLSKLISLANKYF